jgi:hypothetical protein
MVIIIQPSTVTAIVNTNGYSIYNWMTQKCELKRVNHGKGEYARDEE